MKKTVFIIEKVSHVSGIVSGILMTIVMLIVVSNIIMRRFFAAPIFGATELVKYGMMIAASFSLINYEWVQGNIQMTIILEHLREKVRLILNVITNFLGFLGFAYVTYYVGLQTAYKFGTNEVSSDLLIPVWIMVGILSLGIAMLAVCIIVKVALSINELITGKSVHDIRGSTDMEIMPE